MSMLISRFHVPPQEYSSFRLDYQHVGSTDDGQITEVLAMIFQIQETMKYRVTFRCDDVASGGVSHLVFACLLQTLHAAVLAPVQQ